MKNLLAEIFDELNLKPPPMKGLEFAGRTDKGIFVDLISHLPDKKQAFLAVKQRYTEYMEKRLTASDIQILDGAEEALTKAAEMGMEMGLCTGNFKEVAWKKIETAGLKDFFSFGGFGCNHTDRRYLPDEAHQSYVHLSGEIPRPERYVVIGDTPSDIHCARHFGARVVAVTTGNFNEKTLRSHAPDFILPGLAEASQWITEL